MKTLNTPTIYLSVATVADNRCVDSGNVGYNETPNQTEPVENALKLNALARHNVGIKMIETVKPTLDTAGNVGDSANHHASSDAQPITIETHDGSLTVQNDENLLDALLAGGYEVEYQCRSGYCGSCRVTKITGDVTYDETPLAHLNGDEILPCCCRAKSHLKLQVEKRQTDSERQGRLFDD